MRRIAQAVGLTEEHDVNDALTRFLATRRALLVLDNLEQIPDAGPALARLASSAAGSVMLVTSRVRLRIAAEQVFEVQPLALPARSGSTAASVAESAAGALFLARAQAARPGFFSTDADAPTLAAICYQLDGLPLAIELAAAWVAVLSLEELRVRLDSRLSILKRGSLDVDPRQQTLRATVEWSFDLLDEAERGLFARLGVFTDGWTLDAAEAVCGLDDLPVLDILMSLLEKSLVTRRTASDGGVRFSMLETIREYALERLAMSDEADRLRESHLRWFARLVEGAADGLLGPHQDAWCLRIEDDYANIRSALDHAMEADTGTAISMAVDLKDYWELRGLLREARECLAHALERVHAPSRTVAERVRCRRLGSVLRGRIRRSPAACRRRIAPGFDARLPARRGRRRIRTGRGSRTTETITKAQYGSARQHSPSFEPSARRITPQRRWRFSAMSLQPAARTATRARCSPKARRSAAPRATCPLLLSD